jgi:hypothetical protein
MKYNVCKTCGAKDGRAGLLVDGECENCNRTRQTGEVCVHGWLERSAEEIKKLLPFWLIQLLYSSDTSHEGW